MEEYVPTIGIECHVQLATATKLFSRANNDARIAQPNENLAAIDFGLPGMLPLLNKKAVDLTIKAGLALGSQIATISRFDRKHYFYPDLPKGYQITQLYQPIIGKGKIEVTLKTNENFTVRINHAHLEEDAGKLTHPDGSNYSLIDLNRAGTPLIEIVSEPDMHSAAQAKAFAWELYLLMTYAGITRGDLYHGNMRFDVNISVAKIGAKQWGKRAEIKNLNSFRAVEKVVDYEFKRQVECIKKGEIVVQETRGWNDAKQKTFSQRSKEDAQDYRYMPEPDVPPVIIDQETIKKIKSKLPVLPHVYRQAWQPLNLDSSVTTALLSDQKIAQLILSVQKKDGDAIAKKIANWLTSAIDSEETSGDTKLNLNQNQLSELAHMSENSTVNSTAAKKIFNEIIHGNTDSAETIANQKNLIQVSDHSEIEKIVERVLLEPSAQKAVMDVKNGNDKAIGFLVGLVMKQSKGTANPELAQKLIRKGVIDL